MASLPPYHTNPQLAAALLGPVRGSLHELRSRTDHYGQRLRFATEADRAAVLAAVTALAAACAELDRLVGDDGPARG